ncbi:sepiapterin reductase-like [Ischnura elegans]|uniref:sepiapterin reductase-like n=1 Tax=Ischnura elegans TaxID=197161 RepID=UPI001ED8BB3C|nr:sepiapterin reductase-like [Ischnura elegans]XP_046383643.1 sepiapterin reductase-like [Ischnura elegans]XP_046383644.1 sepiapterin reductase-like [Ischnura elegans]XP_046383645.1 sepiapterin reductase-like [Ischnura elegans]
MLFKNPFSSQKVFCVVTGASRGIGRTISVELARRLPSGSVCLLLARSASGLADTKNLAEAANPKISIICCPVDLTQPKEKDLRNMIIDGLDDQNPADFDQIILIHNVGSVGDVSERAASMGSLSKWQEYFALNVFSVAVLNSELLKLFNSNVVKNRLVVNITSKCGLVAFKSMGYYCCGKAAREMYFKVLAIEEEGRITVLNYSPGPVETDMFHEIIENVSDNDQRKVFSEMKERKTVLTCEQTVSKLCNLLEKGNYKSGDHVDYFD